MEILKIPFNEFIDVKKAEKEGHIFSISDNERYKNHLGTVHASAQFSLAEATSGQYLLDVF